MSQLASLKNFEGSNCNFWKFWEVTL